LGRHAVEGALDVKNVTLRDKGAELLSLNPTDFGLVGADREDWNSATSAEVGDVVGIAVDDAPTDTGSDSSLRNLRHASADRLHENGAGVLDRVLNDLEELLGLIDGIVVGVDHLNVDAEAGGHFRYRYCLFCLVVVVSGDEGNNYIQFVHEVEPAS